jgi:hypothetical protein
LVKIRVFGGRIKESIFGWRWFDLRIVMKCSERYIAAYIFLLSSGLGSNLRVLGALAYIQRIVEGKVKKK